LAQEISSRPRPLDLAHSLLVVMRSLVTVALVAAGSLWPGVAQQSRHHEGRQEGHQGQHLQQKGHHSWDYFYENMCGCVATRNEGCGLSSRQLYKTLTESYGLQLCEGRGEEDLSKLEPAVAKRVRAECNARLRLRDVALEFQACWQYEREDICQMHQDTCEWEAQDIGSCGIDEEKLLAKLLGEELHSHPLMRNVLAADKCSTYSSEGCMGDEQCSLNWHRQTCRVHSSVTFNSFLEHPALFEVLEYSKRGAECRGWHEHVWHGDLCWEQGCQLEGGLCVSKYATLDSLKANATIVKYMMDHLCSKAYRETGAVQQGCLYSEEQKACVAEDLSDSVNLDLTEDDRSVALYFMVLRSATFIHEARCNSLDNDILQCNKTAEQHIDCGEDMFHPNATAVIAGWQAQRGQHGHGDGGNKDWKETEREVMNTTMKNIPNADAGIGFNGELGEIIGNATDANRIGFLDGFKDFLNQPETLGTAKAMLQLARSFEAPAQQPSPPTPEESAHKQDEPLMQLYLVCVVCLVLAAMCGGYAGGVLCGSQTGRSTRCDRRPLLQMQAHQAPDGLVNI